MRFRESLNSKRPNKLRLQQALSFPSHGQTQAYVPVLIAIAPFEQRLRMSSSGGKNAGFPGGGERRGLGSAGARFSEA
jgi:hypothetical protein